MTKPHTGSTRTQPATTIDRMDLIGAYVRHMQAAGYSHNTVEDREAVLRRMDIELPMGLVQATVPELEDWLARVHHANREPWSASTRATYFGHIRGFYGWASRADRPLIDWNPAASLTRPRVAPGQPRPASDEQVAQAISRSPDPWRKLIILAAYAGLRCCELATIERADITDQELIVVGKGGKTRHIPTYPQVRELVKRLPDGLIGDGRPAEYISRSGGQHLRRIGLPGVTMHRFRHWFASTLLDQGVDIRVVQELLGHASLNTTAVYTQVNDRMRQAAVATLPDLVPSG